MALSFSLNAILFSPLPLLQSTSIRAHLLALCARNPALTNTRGGGRDLLGIRRHSINANTMRTMMLLKGVLKSMEATTPEEQYQDASKC